MALAVFTDGWLAGLDKYIWQFEQIYLAIWTNMIGNLNKDILQFRQIHFVTLAVSARAATGWLVGSCRPHVAADGTKTTFFENLNLNLYGSLDLKW